MSDPMQPGTPAPGAEGPGIFLPTLIWTTDRKTVGNEMQRLRVPTSETPFEWAGVTTDGSPLPQAVYGFHVEYFSEDEPIGVQPAQGYATIEEAQIVDGEVWLSMPGGVQVRSALVEAMREAA